MTSLSWIQEGTVFGIRIADLQPLLPAIANARRMVMRSSDGFTAELPMEVASQGILIFERDGGPLPESAGGPFRIFTINSAACGTAIADNCANVKSIISIEVH